MAETEKPLSSYGILFPIVFIIFLIIILFFLNFTPGKIEAETSNITTEIINLPSFNCSPFAKLPLGNSVIKQDTLYKCVLGNLTCYHVPTLGYAGAAISCN